MPMFFLDIKPFLSPIRSCHSHDVGTACPLPAHGPYSASTVKATYVGSTAHHELTQMLKGAWHHPHPNLRDSVTIMP